MRVKGDGRGINDSIRAPGSHLLHSIDRLASRPLVAMALVAADAAWVIYSISVGFESRLETAFETIVAAVTLAMVFVLQHTQARDQLVVQRKLDALLAAVPRADNSLIALEEASDAELAAVHTEHLALRDDAVQPDAPPTW